ncbi:Golgi integral membrane protein [Klebsormidium nitens]|uniref:Golgi integral membrane protein n=1 Tax=Klebsormidium nitens TaxID=105231 RepID=A0A1Y1I680_KLENI|nr:Golgi integral membrane protein [Klebsormidium nitens]|eukprot:GAQ86464.1 Golgi integral membrane protein [Klebsormidium nitens]
MASWLSSRLKAAEQFLNQIDATAADRALKAKERLQQGLGSDTEGAEPRYNNDFSRTVSDLSFTDEGPATGRTSGHSGDESSEAAFSARREGFSRAPQSRERSSFKKVEAPPAADWTELLRSDKNGPGSGAKLVRTASNVSAQAPRASRVPNRGGSGPVDSAPQLQMPLPKTDGKVSEGKTGSMVLPAESSSGSVVTAPGKFPSALEDEALSIRSNDRRPSDEGATANKGEMGTAPGGVNGQADCVKGRHEGAVMDQPESISSSLEPVHTVDADEPGTSELKQETEQQRGIVRNGSGLEAVIPTSDSEEESVAAVEGRRSSGSGDEKGGVSGGETEGQLGTVSESVQQPPSAVEGGESAAGLAVAATTPETSNSEETNQSSAVRAEREGFPTPIEASSARTVSAARESLPIPPEEEMPGPSKPESSTKEKKAGSHQRNFSMREYLGQDLSVKEIETEGVDTDADSESGTDEETDSDSDDSEDERAAELQRQKEEAERQAIERQKAAAAAAALEVTAAETAGRAVKEREDVVALLEKEKEELQLEAADALEKHAKEIARLRATATAGSKAAHVEKSSHSSTRMETYSKEEQLVMENIEKAKALAAAQRALEGVVAQALEARRRVEERELHRAELQKQLSEAQQQLRRLQESPEPAASTSAQAATALAAERERVEADVTRKKQRVIELEARLAAVAGQKREPSERERELERRLQSLTDHLIQKQAQVEALASEKATLALRLETVSSSLHDDEKGDGPFRKRSKHTRQSGTEWWLEDDLEYGSANERAGRSGRPATFDSDASDDDDSKKHRGSILPGALVTALQRFDSLTLGGGRFLRFNTPARVLLALYLLLLHAWVLLVWSVQSDHALSNSAAGVNHAVGGAASKEVSDVWLPGRGH